MLQFPALSNRIFTVAPVKEVCETTTIMRWSKCVFLAINLLLFSADASVMGKKKKKPPPDGAGSVGCGKYEPGCDSETDNAKPFFWNGDKITHPHRYQTTVRRWKVGICAMLFFIEYQLTLLSRRITSPVGVRRLAETCG